MTCFTGAQLERWLLLVHSSHPLISTPLALSPLFFGGANRGLNIKNHCWFAGQSTWNFPAGATLCGFVTPYIGFTVEISTPSRPWLRGRLSFLDYCSPCPSYFPRKVANGKFEPLFSIEVGFFCFERWSVFGLNLVSIYSCDVHFRIYVIVFGGGTAFAFVLMQRKWVEINCLSYAFTHLLNLPICILSWDSLQWRRLGRCV